MIRRIYPPARIRNMARRSNMIWNHSCGNLGLGSFLILLGLYFLGKELGWFSSDISFWPLILIAVGVWMIIGRVFEKRE